MKAVAQTLYQRVTNFTLAMILVLSTAAALTPLLFSQNAGAVSQVVYDSLPDTQDVTYPSLGYAATSTRELADQFQLAGSQRLLDDVTVSFTSWACESGGWNTDDCVSADGATFSHPITVNVYEVGAGGTVGAQIATTTQTIAAPYRPSTDNTNCADSPGTGVIGQWYDSVTAACYNGMAFDATFDFSSQNVTLPNNVIVGVAFNTSSHGYSPVGSSGPYDSLNVSLVPYGSLVGTNVNTDALYWNTTHAPFYTDGGAGGVGVLRQDTGWTGYYLGVTISADILAGPLLTGPADGAVFRTSNLPAAQTWTAVAGATQYIYESYTQDPAIDDTAFHTQTTTNTQRNIGSTAPEGTYWWRVKAIVGGNATAWSEVRTFSVDNTTPVGSDNLPSPVGGTVVITHHIADANPTTGKLRIWKLVGGVQDDSQFYATADLPVNSSDDVVYTLDTVANLYGDGEYVAKFTSRDAAGFATVHQKNFIVDNTDPTITVKDGYVGNLSANVFTNVSFKLYDARMVDKYVLNGTVVDVTNNQWSDANFANIVGKLVQGTNTFTLYDVAGNTSTFEFTYDTGAPTTTIDSYAVSAGLLDASATGTDTASGIQQVTVDLYDSADTLVMNLVSSSFSGSNASETATATDIDVSGLASGDYSIRAYSVDQAGNTSSVAVQPLTIDTTEPTVTIDPLVTTGNTPLITGTIDDADATIVITIDGVDSAATNNGDGTWQYQVVTPLADGTHTVTVVGTDLAGNDSAPVSADLTVDTTPAPTPTTEEEQGAGEQQIATTVTPLITSPASIANPADDPDVQGASADTDEDVEGVSDNAAAIDTDSSDGTVFGLAWYWWLLVIAALGGLTWWIVAALRRRGQES